MDATPRFSQVKSAAEALYFELWRSRRKTTTTGTATGCHATKSATWTTSGSAPIHGKATRYQVPVNVIRNGKKLSKEDTERYRSEKLCFRVVKALIEIGGSRMLPRMSIAAVIYQWRLNITVR
jgi:hypothetical protein